MNSQSGCGINNGRRRVGKLLSYILAGCASITLTFGNCIAIEAGRSRSLLQSINNRSGGEQANKDAIVLETGKPIERGEAARSEEELKRQIDQQGTLSDGLVQRLNQAQAELDEKEQEIERLRQEKGPGQTAADAGVVAMLLEPELHRGGEAPTVAYLSKGSNRLRLKMVVDGERYRKYRAEVRTAEGVEILRSGDLKAKVSRNQMIVEIELAASRFAQGDYMIALSGAAGDGGYEKISTYHFRVVRR